MDDDGLTIEQWLVREIRKMMIDAFFRDGVYYDLHEEMWGVPCGPTLTMVYPKEVKGIINLLPHAPRFKYLCDDPNCCDNGCPDVSCRTCGGEWPCSDWRRRHTIGQIRRQTRYTSRKVFPGDDRMIEYRTNERMRAYAELDGV